MASDFSYELLHNQVRVAAGELISGARDAAGVAEVAARVVQIAEISLARHLPPEQARHIACAAGCGTCCAVNVAVLFPEAVAIAVYLRAHLTGSARNKQLGRLEELARLVSGLEDEERLFMQRSCAFLDENGACLIYPVRPLLCRSVTSTDPESCRQAMVAPIFGEGAPVLMNLLQKNLFETAFAALGEALQERRVDARSSKLACAVDDFVRRPERVSEFLAGTPVALM